jgi:glycosyltransferase involved in cell wall biosynthesis
MTQRMKVLLYSRWPVEFTGGVERFVASLRDALLAHGHVCDVVCPPELAYPPSASVAEVAEAMATHWEQHKSVYDVALFNGEYGYKARGGRTVNVFHGTSRGQLVADWRLRHWCSALAEFVFVGRTQGRAGRRHFPVAVSRSAASQLFWLYGIPGARVIQNAVDTERYAPGDRVSARRQLGLPLEPRIYLYASRVEGRKCPWFVSDWAHSLTPAEHLLVATDKPLDVSGQVTSLLNVPRETMPLLYQAADAFLMPSYFEGCAYTVVEAMSCGCLLVASPVGHAPDIVASDPALANCFERRRNAAAFLARVRRLLDDAPLADDLRARERHYALQNNALDKMGQQYESLFQEIARR